MTASRRMGAAQRRLVLAGCLLMVVAGGCATGGTPLPRHPGLGLVAPGSPLSSRSLPAGEAWLRHYLVTGEHDDALQILHRSEARERDALLRSLQEGVILQQAGRFGQSNRAFEAAEREADLRYTKSIRRGAGSLLINDRVLAYSPSLGEMALIPYYRMQNYLALGSLEGAAVEARKANTQFARLASGQSDPCAGFGMIQYLGGMVLHAAGEPNDAFVTLRLADRTLSACAERGGPPPPLEVGQDLVRLARLLGIDEVADSVRLRYDLPDERPGSDYADVVIVLDEGFAAHRVQQDVLVPIFRAEVEGIDGDENSLSVLDAAGRITARVVASLVGVESAVLWDARVWNPITDSHGAGLGLAHPELAYLLRLAWPVTRLEASRPTDVRLRVNGGSVEIPVVEDVSARMVRELESRRVAILTRMVARGVARYVAVRGLEDAAEKKGGEVFGFLAGLAGNAAANALEQADTRSWSLLPDQIAMTRVRVPAGTHDLSIEVPDGTGGVREVLHFGEILVHPGERVFLSRRVWGNDPGDRDRLMRLGSQLVGAEPIATPADRVGSRGAEGPIRERVSPRSDTRGGPGSGWTILDEWASPIPRAPTPVRATSPDQ